MKKRLFAVLFLALLTAGCSKPSVAQPEAPVTSVDENIPDETAESQALDTYPEKPQVKRLMYRAQIEFEAGRFNEALAIVEEALQVAPASVAAAELKPPSEDPEPEGRSDVLMSIAPKK